MKKILVLFIMGLILTSFPLGVLAHCGGGYGSGNGSCHSGYYRR